MSENRHSDKGFLGRGRRRSPDPLDARLLGPVWSWQRDGVTWEVVPVEVGLRLAAFAGVWATWLALVVGRVRWTTVVAVVVGQHAVTTVHELGHVWAGRRRQRQPRRVRFYRQPLIDWGDDPVAPGVIFSIALWGPLAAIAAGLAGGAAIGLSIRTLEGFIAGLLIALWGVMASGIFQLLPAPGMGSDGTLLWRASRARRRGWDLVVWDERSRPHPYEAPVVTP